MTAQRRAEQEPARRPDPVLEALAALIRSASDNRRARRARLMTIIVPAMTPEQFAERFWSRVDKSAGADQCWPWTGSRQPDGYGTLSWRGRSLVASRVALELSLGRDLGKGFYACHTCDNPPCCNPAHLFSGTHSENLADLDRRLRDLAIAHAEGRLADAEYLARRDAIRSEPPRPAEDQGVDAAEVVRWVRDLPDAWAEASPDARRGLVAAVYERIVIEGDRFVDIIPTAFAEARGLTALLPPVIELVSREGDGRSRSIRVSMPVRGRDAMLRRLRGSRTA